MYNTDDLFSISFIVMLFNASVLLRMCVCVCVCVCLGGGVWEHMVQMGEQIE